MSHPLSARVVYRWSVAVLGGLVALASTRRHGSSSSPHGGCVPPPQLTTSLSCAFHRYQHVVLQDNDHRHKIIGGPTTQKSCPPLLLWRSLECPRPSSSEIIRSYESTSGPIISNMTGSQRCTTCHVTQSVDHFFSKNCSRLVRTCLKCRAQRRAAYIDRILQVGSSSSTKISPHTLTNEETNN